jgi:putative ABC transport system ATP-binding protein
MAIEHVVRVNGVYKEYLLGTERVAALKNASLLVRKGEFLAIAGPSGSGKSTLLNIIGCIDTPTEGQLCIDNVDVTNYSHDELADLRACKIGFIFQTFNLLPVLTAWENVEYPMLNRRDINRKVRQERVRYYLDMVGLSKVVSHRPNQMSGGQRQRVAIARALAIGPSIVLADEPTANLDHNTGLSILALMKQINKQEKATFIFSTHDAQVIAMADRVVRLTDGEIIDSGYDFSGNGEGKAHAN